MLDIQIFTLNEYHNKIFILKLSGLKLRQS